MVGVIIIIMVVFDAQAAGRAKLRALIGPTMSKARVITRPLYRSARGLRNRFRLTAQPPR
jgi:hypothetical protein